MSEPNNTDRFTGLADIYADHRPTYPSDVITALADQARTSPTSRTAIDIGCGTGISTMALAQALPDWQVLAVEPNTDMLDKAKATSTSQSNIEFIQASAEALPGDTSSAGLILAAQAMHWFDHAAFFAEAARTLEQGGTLAILYNNRQNAVSAVLRDIEGYLEAIADGSYNRDYRKRDIPAMLDDLDGFERMQRVRKIWLQPTSSDELVNYFMSRSMLQPLAKKVGLSKIRQRIGDIADAHTRSGMIDLPFATELDMATRI